MDEYIEKEAVIAKLDELCRKWRYTALMPLFIDAIDSLPYYVKGELKSADVQPVKHGKWIYYKNNGIWDIHKCTVCNTPFELPMDVVPSSVFCYCPHCGADMRGEENDT